VSPVDGSGAGYQTVQFDVAGDHVATITLNRPQVLNSFNQTMLEEFSDIWRRCRTDDTIHAIVLRANGDRAFSTGVDRKESFFRHPNPYSEDDPGVYLGAKQNRVWKPLICALHGMVAGGAFYWINEADVVICAEGTTFFDPHTSFGMVSAVEASALLRRIPMGEAIRIALFGLDERLSASRAHQIGLVSEVIAPAELFERAEVLARRLAAKPALAVQGTVKAIWSSLDMSLSGARDIPGLVPHVTELSIGQTDFVGGPTPPYDLR